MAKGNRPAARISFIPADENASWREIGVVWSTKKNGLLTGEITMLPMEALATGKFTIAVQAIDQEGGA